jgi:D-alanyl-D-alanine carboxypeptidase/D-alanyl-D-alanine-endopeptidase (penicillin-binding protein 4)
LSGEILLADSPKNANIISISAKTFNQLSSKALQTSNNFTTDYLLAEFGTYYGIYDWKNCCVLLKKLIMQKFNVDFGSSTIADGSGLSRYNMFTVNQFDEFLSSIYNRSDFNELTQMLAKPNEEGTLKNRFKNVKIFAKTGSLGGVSSLVGYIFDKHNTPYSFAIVTNNFLGPKDKYASMEEELLRAATGN